jgi:putative intracellular protease/amidase
MPCFPVVAALGGMLVPAAISLLFQHGQPGANGWAVPFLIEGMLKANGGLYENGPDWGPYVVVDGNLVTGQNPASSEAAAKELLKLL